MKHVIPVSKRPSMATTGTPWDLNSVIVLLQLLATIKAFITSIPVTPPAAR